MHAPIDAHLIVVWEYALFHRINRTQERPNVCIQNNLKVEKRKERQMKHLAKGFLKMRGRIFCCMYARAGERGRRAPSNGFTSGSIALLCCLFNPSNGFNGFNGFPSNRFTSGSIALLCCLFNPSILCPSLYAL